MREFLRYTREDFRKHPIIATVVVGWLVVSLVFMATGDRPECYYYSQQATDC